jgi:peptide/nickel transport system permease protein
MGTDRPLVVQYLDWVAGLPFGDFGYSAVIDRDLSPLIVDRVQVSLILVGLAMLVAVLVAVPLGTFAAVRHRRPSGVLLSGLSQVGVAVPSFLAGILLVVVFAVNLGWLPANGWTAPAVDPLDFLRRVTLPVLALASVQAAVLTRYVRSAVLEVMREDYLRTARAKGLSRTRALLRHGLRNAAIPVLTVTGVQLAALVIGAVVIERVFVVPGLGSMLLDAVGNRDLVAVQSVVMTLVLVVIVVNFLTDVLYTVLDPRLRSRA